MTSKKQLKSFTSYCKAHPEERFWQALRNWSEYDFIIGREQRWINEIGDVYKDEDTFYKE